MNDNDTEDKTTLSGEWVLENDGLWSKYISIHYRHGRVDRHTLESNVTEKEYFKRRLDGTD